MATDDERTSALEVLRGSRILAYAVGAITLIAGLVLIFWTDRTLVFVARFAGVLLIAIGLAESFEAVTSRGKGSYWGLLLFRGLLNLGMGAALVFWPGITLQVIVWIFGLNLLIGGAVGVFASFSVPKELGRSALLFRSVVGIVVGLAVLAWPNATLTVIAYLIAFQLVAIGLILLWSGWQLTKIGKDAALQA